MILTTTFLIGAGISAGLGLLGGLAKGYAQNEADKNTVKELRQQLDQSRQANALNIMNQQSGLLLQNETTALGLDSEISAYNAQIEQLSMQGAQSVGSAVAKSATTGFRNSGANTNVRTAQETANRFNSSYLMANLNNQRINNGLSVMNAQSSATSAMAGYQMNIAQAKETADLKIKNIGAVEGSGWDYLFSKRAFVDAGLGAFNGALSYASSNANLIAEDWAKKLNGTGATA